MNQEKIGSFIAKCRKEKKMTQQDLAKKLEVTDKAVSKWENGRCLMDISMLKPLSECLGISVMELINGERIEKENMHKMTDEVIENTLSYANNKVNERIKSFIRVFLTVIIILCFFAGYFFYKMFAFEYIYNVDLRWDTEYELNSNALLMDKEIEIYNKKISEDEYLNVDNLQIAFDNNKYFLKIRNDFSGLERNESDGVVSYHYKYNGTDKYNWLYGVSFSVNKTSVDMFRNDVSNELGVGDSVSRREKFLLDNNIKNDIDLWKYISKNYNLENNWITMSIRTMRDNYMMMRFVSNYGYNISSSEVITGDYDGYVFNYEYDYSGKKILYRNVYIIDNDVVYEICFSGDEFTTDEYIKDIISTLVFV